MTTTLTRLFFISTGFFIFGSVLAGALDPPGPPAPTMVTLQQIYDRLATPGVLAKTGQTGCWDASGNPVSCTGTGEDGAYRLGVSVSPRFTDNANGTVKDNLTGLIWLKNANCFGSVDWTSALSDANTLASGACGLTDGSVAAAWRLPNIREIHSLIDFSTYNPALPAGNPFPAVVLGSYYWSSTSQAAAVGFGGGSGAWTIEFADGITTPLNTLFGAAYVWPVRGGQ